GRQFRNSALHFELPVLACGRRLCGAGARIGSLGLGKTGAIRRFPFLRPGAGAYSRRFFPTGGEGRHETERSDANGVPDFACARRACADRALRFGSVSHRVSVLDRDRGLRRARGGMRAEGGVTALLTRLAALPLATLSPLAGRGKSAPKAREG